VSAGSRIALLGPSGAGKTLTLRLLAGIIAPDRARVRTGARALHELPAEERRIGYLPQQSALLPRRTVWQQVTFAVDADPGLAAWWLEQLGLAGLHDRLPDELSGGQQRRVALARALARGPSLVLLDEPFSALDAPVRRRLYRDLRRLQRQAGLTTLLVTHDPEEAALLADEVIVLVDGQLLQHGPTPEVFAHPASREVAALLGIPNVNSGRVMRRGCILAGGCELLAPTAELDVGNEVLWSVHPEDVAIDRGGPYPATVIDALDLGARRELLLALGELELTARIGRGQPVPAGSTQRIQLRPETIDVWPARRLEPVSS
jgi:molybdate transport system permease protein